MVVLCSDDWISGGCGLAAVCGEGGGGRGTVSSEGGGGNGGSGGGNGAAACNAPHSRPPLSSHKSGAADHLHKTLAISGHFGPLRHAAAQTTWVTTVHYFSLKGAINYT